MHDDLSYTRAIKNLAAEDRPREKAAEKGFRALTTAELLAILIGSGSQGESVVDLCQRILNSCDNKLYRLCQRSIGDLTGSFRGVGEAKATTILAALEIARRYRDENECEPLPQVTRSQQVFDYIKYDLWDLPHEEFWIITLNRAKRITGKFRISRGGTSQTVVDIKILLKTALQQLADCIIAVHNHPSGTLHPGTQDDIVTENIRRGCDAVGIPLIDHVIVSRNGYYSYMDNGKL